MSFSRKTKVATTCFLARNLYYPQDSSWENIHRFEHTSAWNCFLWVGRLRPFIYQALRKCCSWWPPAKTKKLFCNLGYPNMNLCGFRNSRLNQARLGWPSGQNPSSKAINHQSGVWNHRLFSRVWKDCAQLTKGHLLFLAPKQQKLYDTTKNLCFSVCKTRRFHSFFLLCPRHLSSTFLADVRNNFFFHCDWIELNWRQRILMSG